jgi:hypothetical protein
MDDAANTPMDTQQQAPVPQLQQVPQQQLQGDANDGVDPAEAARQSRKENRVYVGNLSYEVRSNHLKDFMREGERLAVWT